MIEQSEMASQLSLTQIDALNKLVQRMASTLTWPQNRKSPEKTGFADKDYQELAFLLKTPEYATTERLEQILIPIQDHFLAKIEKCGQENIETEQEIKNIAGNVKPLFNSVRLDMTEMERLVTSYEQKSHTAQEAGYVVSLIATIIDPPKAQVFYPEFGRK